MQRKLDTQVRQEQIAQAALELVAAQGVGQLSVAAVARRVGIVPSGIYRHFGSKHEMLLAVLDLLERRLGEIIAQVDRESTSSLQWMENLLSRHAKFVREGRAIPRIVFSDEVHREQPERKRRVRRILEGLLARMAAVVERGQQEGEIDPACDARAVATMLLGIMVPGGILWHLTEGEFDITRHVRRTWPVLRAAISRQD
jgi:AcrR family transcriptional regulator